MLPPDLDFFITLSSVSNIVGNAGQANYCAGNSFQDALCEYRRSLGLRGTSISLGSMTNIEDARSNSFWNDLLVNSPHLRSFQFKESDFWCVLKACIRGTAYQGVPVHHSVITSIKDDLEPATATWANDRKFELRLKPSREIQTTTADNNASGKDSSPGAQLESARNGSEAATIVESAIRRKLADSMSMHPEQIDSDKPLQSYSVDSLKAVQVRNWMFKELKAEISIFDILGQMSISKMAVKIVMESKLVKEEIVRQAKDLDTD